MHWFGLLFAVITMVSWSFGDFLIQKNARLFGSWKSLIFICGITVPVLLPFIWRDLFNLDLSTFILLLTLAVVSTFAAFFDFEALRLGKISVIEPIMGLEVPVTAALSIMLWGEHLNIWQGILVITAFFGVMLAVTKSFKIFTGHKIFEKGVILAVLGAITMAMTNFLTGASSQETSPLLTIWFMHGFVALVSLIVLIRRKQLKSLIMDFKKYPKQIIGMSFFDNTAWISFAYAMTYIPIAIATTITESYIVFASLLGIWLNHEKLHRHQYAGIAIAIVSIIVLSAIT